MPKRIIPLTDMKVLKAKLQDRPEVNHELCTGCGTCVDQCPVAALSMSDILPKVTIDKCITCFCCQEICPEKAITLK